MYVNFLSRRRNRNNHFPVVSEGNRPIGNLIPHKGKRTYYLPTKRPPSFRIYKHYGNIGLKRFSSTVFVLMPYHCGSYLIPGDRGKSCTVGYQYFRFFPVEVLTRQSGS